MGGVFKYAIFLADSMGPRVCFERVRNRFEIEELGLYHRRVVSVEVSNFCLPPGLQECVDPFGQVYEPRERYAQSPFGSFPFGVGFGNHDIPSQKAVWSEFRQGTSHFSSEFSCRSWKPAGRNWCPNS